MSKISFREWIEELEESVIQGEYGYEPGEFTVYSELWRGAFRLGRTPKQAFDLALEAYDVERRRRREEDKANWERIQAADEAAIAREKIARAAGIEVREVEG